jgi:hypothetical protein
VNTQTGWIFKILLYLDVFWCGVVWGDSDVTISSMTGLELRKPQPQWWAVALGWFLNTLQPGHCESAIAHDTARAQQAIKLLNA